MIHIFPATSKYVRTYMPVKLIIWSEGCLSHRIIPPFRQGIKFTSVYMYVPDMKITLVVLTGDVIWNSKFVLQPSLIAFEGDITLHPSKLSWSQRTLLACLIIVHPSIHSPRDSNNTQIIISPFTNISCFRNTNVNIIHTCCLRNGKLFGWASSIAWHSFFPVAEIK